MDNYEFHIKLNSAVADDFDKFLNEHGFTSRSACVQHIIVQYIKILKEKKEIYIEKVIGLDTILISSFIPLAILIAARALHDQLLHFLSLISLYIPYAVAKINTRKFSL